MAEGFLEITGITTQEGALEGEIVQIIIHTINNGARDDFKVELLGDFIGLQEFRIDAGLTKDVIFSFTMPNYDISITTKTYHWVEDVGWVWDTSSVWELLFPFMNIHSQPYKQ